MKRSWKELMRRKNSPAAAPDTWKRNAHGAIPVTPAQERSRKLGTAKMAANRGSERMNRALRSAFVAVFEMLAVIAIGSAFGRLMYELYKNTSVGRGIIQAVVATAAFATWLVFTRERYKDETRRAIRAEHEAAASRAAPRGVGAHPAGQGRRVPGVGGDRDVGAQTTPIRSADDITRTDFERGYDQHPDWDKPV